MTGFSDVPASHPYAADITWAVSRGLMAGYPDGRFRPDELVRRRRAAVVLHRLAGSPAFAAPSTPSFGDVPTSAPEYRQVEWLGGRTSPLGPHLGTSFRPDAGLLRGELATLLHRVARRPRVALPLRSTFADVGASSSHWPSVEWVAQRGVLTGRRGSDGVLRFSPAATVSRALLARALRRHAEPPACARDVPHLLRRTTFGVTPELLGDVAAAGGAAAWLDRQLAPAGIPDPDAEAALAAFPSIGRTPPEVDASQQRFHWDAMFELQAATIARQALSKRQLLEVMVSFWGDHLNVTCPSSDVWATRPHYDRTVLRAHALGRFEDMLVACVTSPAMLQYLDAASSRASSPNENLGRELLELHTVGRDAGYTQDDVVAAARALTGLSVWDPWNGGTASNLWTTRYRAEWHHVGPLSVLGWSSANPDAAGGQAVATSLVRFLANHPATARRLARKLVVRFVSDDPPGTLVDRLADVYLRSGTAVVPVLRALFGSAEFAAAVGRKTRRPLEDLVATLRACGAGAAPGSTGKAWRDFIWLSGQCGQAPMSWPQPDGYPDTALAWAAPGQVLARWNMHVGVTGRWWRDGITWPDLFERLVGARPATRDELVQRLFDRLLPGLAVPVASRDALVAFLGGAGPVRDADVTWLFPVLVALVLDSPHWSTR